MASGENPCIKARSSLLVPLRQLRMAFIICWAIIIKPFHKDAQPARSLDVDHLVYTTEPHGIVAGLRQNPEFDYMPLTFACLKCPTVIFQTWQQVKSGKISRPGHMGITLT
jgi:hypothetical protein